MSNRFKGSSTGHYVRAGAGGQPNTYGLTAHQLLQSKKVDDIDAMMGFERHISPQDGAGAGNSERIGWLCNMHPTVVADELNAGASGVGVAGVDFYFLDEEGGSFKSTILYDPYFLLSCQDSNRVHDVEEFLKKYLEGCLKTVEVVQKDDLAMDNHLVGLKRTLLKLNFVNTNNLFEARKLLRPILKDNEENQQQRDIYSLNDTTNRRDAKMLIDDIREYDVPYHVRVCIDKEIRVGKWYRVTSGGLVEYTDKVAFADPVVLAFDIETTKAPLKFPDSAIDQIMMISYMIDGEGYLITNREIISEDIEDFEYTPKPEYQGLFTVFNEEDERSLLERFFEHIRDVRPTVISTFNGDFFDWPFVEARSKIRGLSMFDEIGFAPDSEGEYKSSYCAHMDCYRWVKRDSYLPQGSQGLKAVTQVKLGYNPIELDPELMTPYAYEKPQHLSEYSVSDAVATYYLYMKYVHPFIFSLCTVLPLNPDEVLRKGTGTLCEMLLMVQAYDHGILLPNKHTEPIERFYDGHLLESETYVGGHVESLEAGVFRSDIDCDFTIDSTAIDELLQDLPHALKFCIEVENKTKVEDVLDFEDILNTITEQLQELKMNNKRKELPLIYHVDVASMYPNIMTTNRLQPDSMKTERDCASCDFNRPGKKCDRRLKWTWRGEFLPAKMDEYAMVKRALMNEVFPNKYKNTTKKLLTFDELSYSEQVSHIKKRLSEYSRKVYHRVKVTESVVRESIVCQRENPFYVNTVRSFRDRRYEFKGHAKTWKKKLSQIDPEDKVARDEARKMIVLYDSLQLAHKVILNSFYGYAMRKGSRWYSIEMAGITCSTGATIIQMARALVERIGRPLELDTDGIWCIIPRSFPENFEFTLKNGKKLYLSYPCSMLNYKVHQSFTNHQYQELVNDAKHKYKISSDNSIFFEVDGPYKAMILPTSKEEGKGIKKRYAVFNEDGSLAELKGFELKRRGELQLIKNFQQDIFKVFLEGRTLEECYGAVAKVANRWLDILDSKGSMLETEDLIDLICENKSMSKKLKEYDGQKSTSITTARRLGEFLGQEMVKDAGLQCKFIISSKPANAPVTERAIPVAIFSADHNIKKLFLRKWLLDSSLDNFDLRAILDWNYYRERLASVIQKIITIPAALQNVNNPVPRVDHPEWLRKKIATSESKFKQTSIGRFFKKSNGMPEIADIEDNAFSTESSSGAKVARVVTKKKRKRENETKDNQPVLPSVMPAIDEDYVGWLNYQKIKWQLQAEERHRRKQLFGSSSTLNDRSALGNIIKKHAESYANSDWEILQYKNSSEPGVVEVHALISGKVQSLKFHIHKTVFLKFKTDTLPPGGIPNCVIEKSNAILPNTKEDSYNTSSSLFRVTCPETVFLDEQNKVSSVFNSGNILGIYESTIPASERAIMELGNAVKFKSNVMGALSKGLQHGFQAKNLLSVTSERYLQRFDLEVIYLLNLTTNLGYEFFVLFNGWGDQAKVFVLKPSIAAQELSRHALEAAYEQQYLKKVKNFEKFRHYFMPAESAKFELHHFTDKSVLLRSLSKVVSSWSELKGSQLLLLLQSPTPSRLLKSIRILNQLPVVQLSTCELAFPTLNWQDQLIKKTVSHILQLGSWLSNLTILSNYTRIPICNLNLTNLGYVIDIMYARRLKLENIVLWWNQKQPLPDRGGIQNEYNPHTLSLATDLTSPVINNPEFYDSAVLEIEVNNLLVNTILTSTLINEAEGGDVAGPESGGREGGGFVEDAFSTASVNILRSLLKDLWDDALQNNSTADSLVHSFIGWVQSVDSKLFDYTLRYYVNMLTKKALFQLINEFRFMGSQVVFLDRNKILLKTSKNTIDNSYAYGQYLIKAIRTRPLFSYLDLKIVRYWDILLWMDQYNHGGCACLKIEEKERQDIQAYSSWHIKNFLAPIYQQEFDDWLVIILDSMIKCKQQFYELSGTQRLTQLPNRSQAADEDDENSVFAGFTKRFYQPFINRISKLYKTQQEYILDPNFRADYIIPDLPGRNPKMKAGNPLLELVKSLCHVLLLCKERTLEVRALRKEALEVFEIREFDSSASFENPASSLIINNFMCENCAYFSDLDICMSDLRSMFKCSKCYRTLRKPFIEENLIQKLQIQTIAYISQDLRCAKCRKIKSDTMSAYCTCSGKWVQTISKDTYLKNVQLFYHVAEYFGFSLLLSAIKGGI
ncbi:AFR657Cp [Eremothecium gossypii ATCC 10895]|uniref:DNA polymerase epsilon catalytic subunit A n=1 Tax=Eremothecium gossypii (strain ATCC 10895 / CBS 109.51 / FGSC 9923 / NRRL Y-1056) TaxID=284811 RepID=DPOE_EREGS|nr:AFR657Cp [Eremothecium gossypii ATCC 10895]Q752B8.2 RecName: Full=DNA polymerase epsilon catalytic subunit A; AltName: Full=DNA polymerase II subunit A [Eremothecium gossypii ATCC 10895]AAS54029.2 AFR657Cp [Eremothecium gossypii ATCC 10895]